MPLYALTIFTGAFLLFQVQPLMAKYLLPWFGGSPGVWTTCLLYFQTLLLGGYAYAHLTSSRLRPRQQATLHLVLLVASLAWLPIMPDASWKPAPGQEPTLRILLVLTASLGLPYFVLSATGPLLQRWFTLTHPGVPPYRLYALSNAGSLLALLSYPFFFEPLFSRTAQGLGWSAGLGVFTLLCGACAWRVRRQTGASAEGAPGAAPDPPETPPARIDRFMWLALPAVASLLLVATTSKLSLDVAVVPFLWVLPLSLYLLSFILCFDHSRWYSRGLFSALLAAGCGVVACLLTVKGVPLVPQVVGYSATLLVACMVCHGELCRLKPSPRHLTQFYLFIAAGGALGGMFAAVLAPLVFVEYRELQLGLWVLACLVGFVGWRHRSRSLAGGVALGVLAIIFLVPALQADPNRGVAAWGASYLQWLPHFFRSYWIAIAVTLGLLVVCFHPGWGSNRGEWRRRLGVFPLLMALLLGYVFITQARKDHAALLFASRNFYGTLQVYEYNAAQPDWHYYLLRHGDTTHGMQLLQVPHSGWPTSYFGQTSGVGRALDEMPGSRRIGVVGLGAGTLATYGRKDDLMRFYEINPAMMQIALTPFTYLRQTAAKVEIALGDARLVMEDELRRGVAQQFDLLVLDAFSSDAIPVHLLTREAFAVYLRHLVPDGVIAVHITNRHLDLRPVVTALAREYGMHLATVADQPTPRNWWLNRTVWILLTKDRAWLDSANIRLATQDPAALKALPVLWTDDHTSLLGVLK